MYTSSISLVLFLCASLQIAATTSSDKILLLSSGRNIPQRPISLSPPSQHPILTYQSTNDLPYPIHGTINVYSYGLSQPTSVTYSLASQVCVPIIPELPYIIADLCEHLLSKHLDGISFPSSSEPQTSMLPVYLAGNVTEQLYRSKYVLSLSLKLSPLASGTEGVVSSRWRSIMALVEQSTLEMDRSAKKKNGMGLGSVLLLDAKIQEVHVLAEWRFWKVVDGTAVMCES